eukprot:1828742-Pyramimonas_sp.AAC.1
MEEILLAQAGTSWNTLFKNNRIRLFHGTVSHNVLYGCEAWTMTKEFEDADPLEPLPEWIKRAILHAETTIYQRYKRVDTIGYAMGARARCAHTATSTSWPSQNKAVGRSATLRTAVRAGNTTYGH